MQTTRQAPMLMLQYTFYNDTMRYGSTIGVGRYTLYSCIIYFLSLFYPLNLIFLFIFILALFFCNYTIFYAV